MAFKMTRSLPPKVVVEPEAAEPVQFAAEELSKYLGRVLGVDMSAAAEAPTIRLLVTSNTDLGEEGFLISEANGDLRIEGGGPAGVVYGVYEFLRQHCGCLFSGLAPDGEYIPERGAIEVKDLPLRMTPKLWYRAQQFYGMDGLELDLARIDWMAKNGFNVVRFYALNDAVESPEGQSSFDPETGEARGDVRGMPTDSWFRKHITPQILKRGLKLEMSGHNLLYFLPPELYFEKHPEWYALQDGERVPGGCQICLCTSNPEMVDELAQNSLRCLETHPEVKILGLAPMDGIGGCECDACRDMDESPDDMFLSRGHYKSPEGENRSKVRRYVRLINQVARAVKERFPDVHLGYVAYADLFFAPRDIELEDNIIPTVGIYWQCAGHPIAPHGCPVNRFFYHNLWRWRKYHQGRVHVYNYFMGMHMQKSLPYPISELVIRDWQFFKEMGVDGACSLSRDSCFKTYNLNYLAFARSAWWNSVDHGRLIDEYLLGMFGEAGKALRPVWDSFYKSMLRIEQEYTSASIYLQSKRHDPTDPGGCLLPTAHNIAFFMDELGEEALDRCITQARSLVSDDRERRQVKDFAVVVEYWKMAAAFFRAYQPTVDPLPDVTADELLEHHREARRLAQGIIEYIEPLDGEGWLYRGTLGRWERQLGEIDTQIKELTGE